MNEFKVGGKITLSEDEKYIVVDIIDYKGTRYYLCSSASKPVIPKVFERDDFDGKTYIKEVNDIEVIKYISAKVANE